MLQRIAWPPKFSNATSSTRCRMNYGQPADTSGHISRFDRRYWCSSRKTDKRVFALISGPCTPIQVSLCNLLVLSLKSCKLRRLGGDVEELGSLRELYLESNLILSLPDAFTRLRTLEVSAETLSQCLGKGGVRSLIYTGV